jgi:hypothetical protein
MSSVRSLLAASLIALACLACCAGSAPAAPGDMVALGVGSHGNTLYSFSPASPATVTATPVVGLGASNLVGIAYRPATLRLYGLGVNGNVINLFTLDPATGGASPVGAPATISTLIGANAYGIAFNPVADRLRVVNDLASGVGTNTNNFRLNPDNGALAGSDTDLDFSALPGGSGEGPLVAVAYDRSVAGTAKTTLYGVVAGGDRLVRLGGVDGAPSPNGGVLSNVGLLGVDTTINAGLDIDPATGAAFAALTVAGVSRLYRVDLVTGAATQVGTIGDGSVDFGALAITPPPPVTPPPPPIVEPKLETLNLKPTAFRAAGAPKAKATGSAKKAPAGTTVSYTISAATTVAFTVERKTTGRRVGKQCLRKTSANAVRSPCPIWKALKPGFSKAGVAGSNSFKFNGKLGTKTLAPGGYKLAARVGTTTLRKPFRIVP